MNYGTQLLLCAKRISELLEHPFPYSGFYSWDTHALRDPAQAHSCDPSLNSVAKWQTQYFDDRVQDHP